MSNATMTTATAMAPYMRISSMTISSRFKTIVSLLGGNHRKHGTLRVSALDDPTAARNLHRRKEGLAATVFHPFRRSVDIIDIEIVNPAGRRHMRRLCHHAADRCAACRKGLIEAAWRFSGLRFGPAEQARIEGESPVQVARIEFMPADVARCTSRYRCGLLISVGREDQKPSPIRVSRDRKPSNIRNIRGRA